MSAANDLLRAENLVKLVQGRRLVDDVSLSVGRGEVVGILGPSGAGKTTIFRMLTGLACADLGRVLLDGADVTHAPLFARAQAGLGYLPQETSVFAGLSVEQNILIALETRYAPGARRQNMLDFLLEDFSLEPVRRSLAGTLSGGERRRCEIARALASQPNLLLLDEPFVGIDPIHVADIKALVRRLARQRIGVLISDHNVRETLGVVDRAYILDGGRLIAHGTPDEIILNPIVRTTYLGEDFQM